MSLGHIPLNGECIACGLQGTDLPLEPCPEQTGAQMFIRLGYMALPESFAAMRVAFAEAVDETARADALRRGRLRARRPRRGRGCS